VPENWRDDAHLISADASDSGNKLAGDLMADMPDERFTDNLVVERCACVTTKTRPPIFGWGRLPGNGEAP
jgi:hypothetical protein